MTAFLKDFVRVTRQRHCPVCDSPDWCAIRRDGSACMCSRVRSETPCGDAGFLHKLTADAPRNDPPPQIVLPTVEPSIDWYGVHEDCQASLPIDDPLPRMLGLPAESLYRMQYGWHVGLSCWTFPMRDGRGEVIGLRTRHRDGSKRCLLGSRTGIFVPSGVTEAPLWICEGPTDCAALLSLGFNAIGRPSNTGGREFIARYLDRWRGREIVLVPDRDDKERAAELTRHGAETLARECSRRRFTVRIVRPPHAKDVREWIKQGADAAALNFAARCAPAWH